MIPTRMTKCFIIIWGFVGISLVISCAQTQQPPTGQLAAPYLDERIDNQFRAIDRSVGLGHFTRHEERILRDNLEYIKHLEARYQASGVFPMADREYLHGLLNKNNLMIERKTPVQTLRPPH